MSRTCRRRGERHEYRWVLRDWIFDSGSCRVTVYLIDRHSPEGRRAENPRTLLEHDIQEVAFLVVPDLQFLFGHGLSAP